MELALHDMLLDRSGGNRQFARYHLSRIAPMDFAAFYHTALADVATEAKALYALSEIAPDEAHLAAEARLASTSRAVLKAALGTLSSEHLYRHRELLIRSIDSNVPGVAKIAGKRLFEIRRLLGIDLVERPELWSEFSETMKRQAIRMATGFQKWDGLEFLIVTSNYQQFLEDVILTLEQWLQKERRVHAKLAPARYTKLQNRLLESQLPTNMIKQLDFVMSHN